MKHVTQYPRYRPWLQGFLVGSTAVASAFLLACGGDGITGPAPVASVTVTLATPSVAVGTKTQAIASVKDDGGNVLNGRPVSWNSSNPDVASVSSTGEVTAHRTGTAEIKATSEGKDGSATVTVIPPPVATVVVTLASTSIAAGASTTATAALSDANGNALTGRVITWTSSDIAVATVSDQGVVTAVKAGNASIIATSEGKSGSAALTVTAAGIHTITVVIADPAIRVGATTQASAVAKDASGNTLTGRPIVWVSENIDVATVNDQGIVTGIKVGTATIKATSEGKVGSASVAVGAEPIHSITVVIADPQLRVAGTTQASAIAKDASGNDLTGRPIVWSSDNPEIATVTDQGVVTGVRVGTANITATSEGKTGSAAVTVYSLSAASITVTLAQSTISYPDSVQATATVRDAAGKVMPGFPVTWSPAPSTGPGKLVVVFPNGMVYATAPGTGTENVVATADGVSGSAPITVVARTTVYKVWVTFANNDYVLVPGETVQATADVEDIGTNSIPGATVTWSSSNPAVATIDQSGLVRGVAPGTATITATSGGVSGQAGLTVTVTTQQSLSAGQSHTCAISTDGDAWCWGSNSKGELGDGTATPRSSPVRVAGGVKFASIAAGFEVTHAIGADGLLYCWGGPPCAQSWHIPGILAPVLMPGNVIVFTYLSSGTGRVDAPTCGIAMSNNAHCWGTSNSNGQAGHGTNNSTAPSIPVRQSVTNEPVKMKELGTGNLHACGVLLDGSARCWGSDVAGQLGRNGNGNIGYFPEPVAGGRTYKDITAGDDFSCALDTTGAAYCWGDNTYGQLGAVTTACLIRTTPCSTTPVAVTGGHTFESIDAGGRDVCAVKSSGDVYCWGEQFGPVPVPFGGGSYRIVSVGGGHACATTTGGDVYCRNKNGSGQLGNGTTVDAAVPTPVVGGVRFKAP